MKKIYLICLILLSSASLFCQEEYNMKDPNEILKDSLKINTDTISYKQKSDIGLNVVLSVFSQAPSPNLTYRNYVFPFLSIELGVFPTFSSNSFGIKYGLLMNFKRLFISLVNFQIINGYNTDSSISNSICIGYNPINTGNTIDFNFRLGIIGDIFTRSGKGIGPNLEFGLKYNFYKMDLK